MSNSSIQENKLHNQAEIFHIILAYFVISVILFYFYQYAAPQDIISYISISEKYFRGEFSDAINGVWGPLISWLMVPLFYFNSNAIINFKILQVLIGSITLISCIKIINLFEYQKVFKKYLIFATMFLIETYVFITGTPDLLFSCILILLTYYLIKFDYKKLSFGIYLGLLGALLYFAKPFGFPLFLALLILFSIFTILFSKHQPKLLVLRNLLIGLFVFVVLVSPWIFLISNKYHKATFSTGGEYNFAIVGPKYRGNHTPRIEKLYKPVNSSATSYWEDPSFLIAESWSPFSSTYNIIYLVQIIIQNAVQIILILMKLSPLLFVFILIINPKEIFNNQRSRILILVSLIYLAGISLLFIQQRFLIAMQFVLFIFTGMYTSMLLNKFKSIKKYSATIFLLVFLSISTQPIFSLFKHLNYDKDIYEIAKISKNKYNITGNIASISDKPLDEDWRSTITISYLLNSKYYGELSGKLDEDLLVAKLKNYGISYLFVWNQNIYVGNKYFSQVFCRNISVFHTLIFNNCEKKLTIYRIN